MTWEVSQGLPLTMLFGQVFTLEELADWALLGTQGAALINAWFQVCELFAFFGGTKELGAPTGWEAYDDSRALIEGYNAQLFFMGYAYRIQENQIIKVEENIRGEGFKNAPLRQAYENEVRGLKEYGEQLLASGKSEEVVARILNQARRDLGVKYKDLTPQPLRDYIYEINEGRYGDKLGPTYDYLIKTKKKSNMDIINSASRPNLDINKLLSGFRIWLRRRYFE